MHPTLSHSIIALCVCAAFVGPQAIAAPFTVEDGKVVTDRQTLTGNETGTVGQGASLQQAGNQTIRWSAAEQGTVTINNHGQN